LTLNQTITNLKGIILSHNQVRHFFFGEPADWVGAITDYPAALLTLEPFRIVPNGVELDFSLYLSDLVHATPEDVNEDMVANTIEVQSDMISVINEIYGLIDLEYDWKIVGNFNAATYSDVAVNDDRVAGCKADFTLFIMMSKNICSIP
jgi:hypothetical protein